MTITDSTIIDFLGLDPKTNEFTLAITDHLDWEADVSGHLSVLHEKLSTYIRFIDSGELATKHPESVGAQLVIEVIANHDLVPEALEYYDRVRATIGTQGPQLRFRKSEQ